MARPISRRTLLKSGVLASATIPFYNYLSSTPTTDALGADAVVGTTGEPRLVKLNSNENPFGPSESARQAIIEHIGKGNLYPRNAIKKLQAAIAENEDLQPEQVLISAGSTELLGVAGLMAGLENGKVISSQPTFDFLLYYASQFNAEWVKVPLTEDHQYNLDGIAEKIEDNTNLIFVCNPNNPTGVEIPQKELRAFCKMASEKSLVYVDEAYIEFTEGGLSSSLAAWTRENKNIIIGRTFSKIYGLAGLRVGYAIAHPHTISKMKDHMMGRGVSPSVTSVAAAQASLGDTSFREHCKKMNALSREKVYAGFDKWGVEYLPSQTSFVLFRTDRFQLHCDRRLQSRNVLIRTYKHVPGWARVSMGTPDDMDVFLAEIEQLLI